MGKMKAIIYTGIKCHLQSLSLVAVYVGISLLCTLTVGIAGVKQFLLPALQGEMVNAEGAGRILQFMSYCTILIDMGVCYVTLYSVPLIREKMRGRMEAILGSPVELRTFWLGRSIALFLPGLVLGGGMAGGLTLVVHYLWIGPVYPLRWSPWLWVTTCIAVPLTYFMLCLAMNLIGFTGRVADGGVLGIIYVSGVVAVMINLGARGTVKADSWVFLALHLGIAAILGGIILYGLRGLRRERIVNTCGT